MPFHPDIKDRELAALLGTGALIHMLAEFATGGAITRVERDLLLKLLRKAGRHVAVSTARLAVTGARVAMAHPALTTLGVIWLAWDNQDEIRKLLAQGYEIVSDPSFALPGPQRREQFRPGPAMVPLGAGMTFPPHTAPEFTPPWSPGLPGLVVPKRKVSRANKAVKKAMEILKKARKGKKQTKKQQYNGFTVAVKAAGLANPNTKSKIGKGNTPTKRLARKLKKWW